MYTFVILDIETNKIIVLVYLKCRPSFHRFYKLVIKLKKIQRYKQNYFS
jgi:hypothetical protein